MRIEDWMKSPVQSVKPRDTVAHARAVLEEYRINQLPVVVNGRVVGIVTDRDLRSACDPVVKNKLNETPAAPEDIYVEQVMSQKVLTLAPSDTVEHAAEIMRRERIGAMPVVEKGRLLGILARHDVLDAFLNHTRRRAVAKSTAAEH